MSVFRRTRAAAREATTTDPAACGASRRTLFSSCVCVTLASGFLPCKTRRGAGERAARARKGPPSTLLYMVTDKKRNTPGPGRRRSSRDTLWFRREVACENREEGTDKSIELAGRVLGVHGLMLRPPSSARERERHVENKKATQKKKKTYLSIPLKRHPDRRGASEGGDAFRRLKAAYDRLLTHTQFDEELEGLGAELEASERELEELETRRSDRELRDEAIVEARRRASELRAEKLAELQVDEARDEYFRKQRREDEDQCLDRAKQSFVLHHHSTRQRYPDRYAVRAHLSELVRDLTSLVPPPAVMLKWPGRAAKLLTRHSMSADDYVSILPVERNLGYMRQLLRHLGAAEGHSIPSWTSDDKFAVIDPRLGPRGELVWVLVEQRYDNVTERWQTRHYWLHSSPSPVMVAEYAGKDWRWASWADAPVGRSVKLDSWAVSENSMRRMQEEAAVAKAERDVRSEERQEEQTLRVEQRKEQSEAARKKARREERRRRKRGWRSRSKRRTRLRIESSRWQRLGSSSTRTLSGGRGCVHSLKRGRSGWGSSRGRRRGSLRSGSRSRGARRRTSKSRSRSALRRSSSGRSWRRSGSASGGAGRRLHRRSARRGVRRRRPTPRGAG